MTNDEPDNKPSNRKGRVYSYPMTPEVSRAAMESAIRRLTTSGIPLLRLTQGHVDHIARVEGERRRLEAIEEQSAAVQNSGQDALRLTHKHGSASGDALLAASGQRMARVPSSTAVRRALSRSCEFRPVQVPFRA